MEDSATEGLPAGVFLAEGAMPEDGDAWKVFVFRFGHRGRAGSSAGRLDRERRRGVQSSEVRFDRLGWEFLHSGLICDERSRCEPAGYCTSSPGICRSAV